MLNIKIKLKKDQDKFRFIPEINLLIEFNQDKISTSLTSLADKNVEFVIPFNTSPYLN